MQCWLLSTLRFQIIGTPQGIEQVTVQLKDTPTKVYAIGAKFFIKGAPRSASKLSIDPIKRHTPYFQKCTGSNKRTVLNNRTMFCIGTKGFILYILPQSQKEYIQP